MSIKLQVDRGTGEILGNFIRQLGIAAQDTYRVIGFTLNTNVNSLDLGTVENAFQVGKTLHDLDFKVTDSKGTEFLEMDYHFQKELFVKDLNSSSVSVNFKSNPYLDTVVGKESQPILTSLDDVQHTLTLYFRKGRGIFSVEQNKQYLEGILGEVQSVVAISSNHSDIQTCSYKVTPLNSKEETLEFQVKGVGMEEVELFNHLIGYGSQLLNKMQG